MCNMGFIGIIGYLGNIGIIGNMGNISTKFPPVGGDIFHSGLSFKINIINVVALIYILCPIRYKIVAEDLYNIFL